MADYYSIFQEWQEVRNDYDKIRKNFEVFMSDTDKKSYGIKTRSGIKKLNHRIEKVRKLIQMQIQDYKSDYS